MLSPPPPPVRKRSRTSTEGWLQPHAIILICVLLLFVFPVLKAPSAVVGAEQHLRGCMQMCDADPQLRSRQITARRRVRRQRGKRDGTDGGGGGEGPDPQ